MHEFMSSGSAATLPFQGGSHYETVTISGSARAHFGNVMNFELPENAAQEIQELQQVISQAVRQCRELNCALAANRTVGKQLQDIAHEPRNLYQVLGTIQACLGNNETSNNILWAAQSESMKDCLETCRATMTEITEKINRFEGRSVGPKYPEVEAMSQMDIKRYQKALSSQKMNLNMAISIASLYQTQVTEEALSGHKKRLATLIEQLENERAEHMPRGLPHYDIDRIAIPVDLDWSTRRFFEASSLLTDAIRQNDPSIQVSSYLEQHTIKTAFWTCASSLSENTLVEEGVDRVVTIFIAGLPVRLTNKLAISIDIDDAVVEIRDLILQRIGVIDGDFGLMHGSTILTDITATLKEYGVRRNSTLHCVSFRHNRHTSGPWFHDSKPESIKPSQPPSPYAPGLLPLLEERIRFLGEEAASKSGNEEEYRNLSAEFLIGTATATVFATIPWKVKNIAPAPLWKLRRGFYGLSNFQILRPLLQKKKIRDIS